MPTKMIGATAVAVDKIRVDFENGRFAVEKPNIELRGPAEIVSIEIDGSSVFLQTTDLQLSENYSVRIRNRGGLPVDLGVLLDRIRSEKELGCIVEGNRTMFRLFAPRARSVKLVLFENLDDEAGAEHKMTADSDGVWERTLDGTYFGKYYGYKVRGPEHATEHFRPQQVIADPYSKAVVTKNTHRHQAKSIILKTDEYDWQGDDFVSIPQEDLIIYEMHVRDLTAHPSAGVKEKGTYRGLIEKNGEGGLKHILELGVNAVELLPCQEFGNIEIPFGSEWKGQVNTWNPYARNHWGYMTSYFFAPESYYASGGNMRSDAYNGIHGQQVTEFKDMVKALHREGIAVIMDVVYNHVSEYDFNPFKYIDKKYFFRLDSKMNFLAYSGCGNDFKTERPMARRVIIDSIKYWMREYHIDGFRFDLATMIDWDTIEEINREVRKINPNVILIAEPWGGGKYDLAGFSDRGWAAWNDLFRNGIKGQNPETGQSWIFGRFWGDNSAESLRRYVRGSLRKYGGPFHEKAHSINYLESHDDHTLGDFIRIGGGRVKPHQKIKDLTANARLTEEEDKIARLAAAFLLTSQGAVMIHAGQEFARSKVIARTDAPDPRIGEIDHNSYNKDNPTNWLDFEHKTLNHGLFEYYQGLIALRKTHPAFRRTPAEQITFLECETDFALGYSLPGESSGDSRDFVVLFNANPESTAEFSLPAGSWRAVADGRHAGNTPFGERIEDTVALPARSTLILATE